MLPLCIGYDSSFHESQQICCKAHQPLSTSSYRCGLAAVSPAGPKNSVDTRWYQQSVAMERGLKIKIWTFKRLAVAEWQHPDWRRFFATHGWRNKAWLWCQLIRSAEHVGRISRNCSKSVHTNSTQCNHHWSSCYCLHAFKKRFHRHLVSRLIWPFPDFNIEYLSQSVKWKCSTPA